MIVKDICRPCAEKLLTDGKAEKLIHSQTGKATCLCCNRRKFCYTVKIKRFKKYKGIYT